MRIVVQIAQSRLPSHSYQVNISHVHYAIMITWTYLLGYYLGWKYESAIDTTIIGSSSHFEVAVAVAVTLYGIGSGAALATVIGPLLEVPLMLSLVKLGLRTRKYFPRKPKQAT